MDAIEEVLKELKAKANTEVFDNKLLKELQYEVIRMSRDQLKTSREFGEKLEGFQDELLTWTREIFKKMAEESFEGNVEKRNDKSAFFRAMIHVFQQPNLFDILVAAPSLQLFIHSLNRVQVFVECDATAMILVWHNEIKKNIVSIYLHFA